MPNTTRRRLLPIAAFTALTLLTGGGLLSPATGISDVSVVRHGGMVPTPGAGPAAGGTTVSGVVPSVEFTAIAAGGGSAGYALDVDGNVWAWGAGGSGQLGNGTTTSSSRPVRVQAATGTLPVFTAIAAGSSTGYALDENGNVWAWGSNSSGQLGDGTTTNSTRPVRVQAATGPLPIFTQVAAGNAMGYALDENGDVWAWGDNYYGQLGNGTSGGFGSYSSRPVRVQAATGTLPVFTAIAGGGLTGYALDVAGNAWAWGMNNDGQLGNGTTTDSLRPVRVQAATGTLPVFTEIAAGFHTGFALDATGNVWAWGLNSSGQLGNGTSGSATNSTRPVRVQAASGSLPVFTAIAGGDYTGYALDVNGHVWAWGYGSSGQLGNGTTTNSTRPVRVQAATGTLPVFTAIAGGWIAGYALDVDGYFWAWGDNANGQLGNGTHTSSSRPVQAHATVGSVTFGGVAGTGLSQDGGTWSVTTPARCGPVDVTVRYIGADETAPTVTYPGGFTFGSPPVFTTQPVSATISPGGVFTATVELSGDSAPNVRWQALTEWGWVDVPGATGTTLRVTPTVPSTFRAVATNCWTDLDKVAYTVYSDTATATAASVSPSPSPSASPSVPGAAPSPSPSPSAPSSVPGASPSPSLPPNTAKATAVGLAMSKVTMVKNTTLKVVLPAGLAGGGVGLSWSSSSPKVATVNTTGVITARQPGRTVVTVSTPAGGVAKLTVTVVSKAVTAKAVKATLKGAGVKGSKTGKTKMKVGKTARLSVQPSPAGATLKKMPTFKSSKPKVASVDRTGLVTAKKKGKTKITIRLAGKKTTLLTHVI